MILGLRQRYRLVVFGTIGLEISSRGADADPSKCALSFCDQSAVVRGADGKRVKTLGRPTILLMF